MAFLLGDLRARFEELDRRIGAFDAEFTAMARTDDRARRLTGIPGDFNEWRERKGFETLPDWLRIHSPGPTFPAGCPFLKPDKVAMTRDIDLVDSTICDDKRAQVASDHRPMRARFSVAGKGSETA